jgi:hypothetical protein
MVFSRLPLTLPLLLGVIVISGSHGDADAGVHMHWDYIVVGAGPAGLQLGHFMKKANRDYVILERNNIPGQCAVFSVLISALYGIVN